jgi:hypothetical protein
MDLDKVLQLKPDFTSVSILSSTDLDTWMEVTVFYQILRALKKKKKAKIGVRFQVLTAASMMFRVVFWDILPCKMIVDRRFRGVYCLHHQGWVSLARKDQGYIRVQGLGGQSWWETIG